MQDALNAFVKEVTTAEAGKTQASVGDTRQILKLVNTKLAGQLYTAIKAWHEAQQEDTVVEDGSNITA